jgi:transposase
VIGSRREANGVVDLNQASVGSQLFSADWSHGHGRIGVVRPRSPGPWQGDSPTELHLARTGFFKPLDVKSPPAHAIRSLISARKKLVGQRVTLENQIRGLAVVFGIRLPRALTAAFVDKALKASEGIAGLSAAVRGLIAARTAVIAAITAIDADMRRMARASAACNTLMTIPGAGQLTALAFVAAIDDPSRIRAQAMWGPDSRT